MGGGWQALWCVGRGCGRWWFGMAMIARLKTRCAVGLGIGDVAVCLVMGGLGSDGAAWGVVLVSDLAAGVLVCVWGVVVVSTVSWV